MPTVLRWGPYRAFFYSNENDEPAHVHVRAAIKKPNSGCMTFPWPSTPAFRPTKSAISFAT